MTVVAFVGYFFWASTTTIKATHSQANLSIPTGTFPDHLLFTTILNTDIPTKAIKLYYSWASANETKICTFLSQFSFWRKTFLEHLKLTKNFIHRYVNPSFWRETFFVRLQFPKKVYTQLNNIKQRNGYFPGSIAIYKKSTHCWGNLRNQNEYFVCASPIHK